MRRDRALTAAQKVDARGALAILGESEITLTQAARYIMREDDNDSISTLLTDAIEAFLKDRIDDKLRDVTVEFYAERLDTFSDAHRNRTLDDFTRGDVMKWALARPGAKSTRKGYLNSIRAMFNWAHNQNPKLVRKDIGRGMTFRLPKQERNISILTPAEARLVMEQAGKYAPCLALMMFCGVRPSEVHGEEKPPLRWKQVHTDSSLIRINANQSKTRSARPMERLPPNLWAWLPDDVDPEAFISPARSRQATLCGKAAIGHWPQDVCRHSFFTYFLAKYENIDRAMLIAGHEEKPSVMYKHYRGLATSAEADEFFSIIQQGASCAYPKTPIQ
jgi:integrase